MAGVKTKKGRKLSRQEVDSLAREAERGYELSNVKPERVSPGRPSLAKGVSPRISYRLAHPLYERAKKKAKAEGRTVSEIAREALERFLS